MYTQMVEFRQKTLERPASGNESFGDVSASGFSVTTRLQAKGTFLQSQFDDGIKLSTTHQNDEDE